MFTLKKTNLSIVWMSLEIIHLRKRISLITPPWRYAGTDICIWIIQDLQMIILYDYQLNKNNWSTYIWKLFYLLYKHNNNFNIFHVCNIDNVFASLSKNIQNIMKNKYKINQSWEHTFKQILKWNHNDWVEIGSE